MYAPLLCPRRVPNAPTPPGSCLRTITTYARCAPQSLQRIVCHVSAGAAQDAGTAPEWRRRAIERQRSDIVQAGVKAGLPADSVALGLDHFKALLPGVQPNADAMRLSDWAVVMHDFNGTAAKLVLLKQHYPRLDLASLIARNPRVLKLTHGKLESDALQVKHLLSTASDLEHILEVLPELLDPRVVFSVLVTLRKWYPKELDPVKVLQRDPDVIRRAQHIDVPLEPVYEDATGQMVAGSYSRANRQPWQKYIDEVVHKRPPGI